MQISIQNILAAGDGNFWDLLPIILFVVISAIIGIVRKAAEKAQTKQSERPEEEQRNIQPPIHTRQARQIRQVKTPELPPIRVAQELELQRRRAIKQQSDRRQRLAPPKIPQADTAAIESKLLSIKPAQTYAPKKPEKLAPLKALVSLTNTDDLRRAFVLHEILSPPKSLRQDSQTPYV